MSNLFCSVLSGLGVRPNFCKNDLLTGILFGEETSGAVACSPPEDKSEDKCAVHVDVNNNSGKEDGSSVNPWDTIQEAVDNINSSECPRIIVRPGTYQGGIIIDGKAITGKIISIESSGGANVTTIDADKKEDVIRIKEYRGQLKTLIAGFTLTNGSVVGINIYNAFGTHTIRHNIIRNNRIGIAVQHYGNLVRAEIRNNLIIGNREYGIHDRQDGSNVVENNTIVGNGRALQEWEGGFFLDNTVTPAIRNNIIAFNSRGITTYYDYTNPLLQFNCVFGNSAGDYARYAQPGLGNLQSNPLFVNFSDDGNWNNDDFHLQVNSPCRNAVNPAPAFNDQDGSRNDIGAYGGPNGNW